MSHSQEDAALPQDFGSQRHDKMRKKKQQEEEVKCKMQDTN